MDKQQAIKILIEHQKWRRGEWIYGEAWVIPEYTPVELWEAIDFILEYINHEKTNTR